jgi:hypothetical protein
VRVGRRWWRPRAWVSDVGQEDARYARRKTDLGCPSDRAARVLWSKARIEHYAGPEERVFDVGKARLRKDESTGLRPRPGFVIFEPVGEPPSWWPVTMTPEKALEAFLAAGRRLDEESHSRRYPPEEREERRSVKRSAEPTPAEAAEDRRRREEVEAEEEAREQVRERAFADECAAVADGVRAQAGDDTFLLETEDGRRWSVPRAPFEQWALGRTNLRHLAAPWTTVSRSGMKLPLDDPNHTDWMLGSGIGVSREMYLDEAVRRAAGEARSSLQRRLARWPATVVVDAGEVVGVVGEEILVVPDMRPEHHEAMCAARAVVAGVGGVGAHLAQLGVEQNKTAMVVPDAVARYPKGTTLRLVPAEGRVVVGVRETLMGVEGDVYLGVEE